MVALPTCGSHAYITSRTLSSAPCPLYRKRAGQQWSLAQNTSRNRRNRFWAQATGPSTSDVLIFDQEVLISKDTGQLLSGVKDSLQTCELPWYLISTHPAKETSQAVAQQTGLEWPADTPRMLADLGASPHDMVNAIRTIAEKPLVKDNNAKLHAVLASKQVAELASSQMSTQLYLADWVPGADTAGRPNIRVITLKQFQELLRWGILMGVDDGCGDDN